MSRGRYVGDTIHHKPDGVGKYIYPNGFFVYEGEWKNGKQHGLIYRACINTS